MENEKKKSPDMEKSPEEDGGGGERERAISYGLVISLEKNDQFRESDQLNLMKIVGSEW